MVEYGSTQRYARDGYWRVMAINDEVVHMEENDSSRKDDQSELEPNWQGEEDETQYSKHTTTTKVQGIWATTN